MIPLETVRLRNKIRAVKGERLVNLPGLTAEQRGLQGRHGACRVSVAVFRQNLLPDEIFDETESAPAGCVVAVNN